MHIVALSDTHNYVPRTAPLDGDLVIHAGDATNFGGSKELDHFLWWFTNIMPQKHKIFVYGNHEVKVNDPKSQKVIKSYQKRYENLHILNDTGVCIDGIKFWGSPWCPGEREIMQHWGFYIEDDAERMQKFTLIPNDTDVLITHTPPLGILDKVKNRHLGCPSLLTRVEEIEPKFHVFGHVHESAGIEEHSNTTFINVSYYDNRKFFEFRI